MSMKKRYMKPSMSEMVLQYRAALLTMSGQDPDIIGTDPDEEIDAEEALSRKFNSWEEW